MHVHCISPNRCNESTSLKIILYHSVSHHFMKINLPKIPGKILHVGFKIDLLIPYFDPNDLKKNEIRYFVMPHNFIK